MERYYDTARSWILLVSIAGAWMVFSEMVTLTLYVRPPPCTLLGKVEALGKERTGISRSWDSLKLSVYERS